MQVQPYVFFDGRCEEAIEFYQRALGAKVETLMRWKESPEPPQPGVCPFNRRDIFKNNTLQNIGKYS